MIVVFRKVKTAVGPLTLFAEEKKLVGVTWDKNDFAEIKKKLGATTHFVDDRRENVLLNEAEKQLGEYFSGKRQKFDLPFKFYGTAFQVRVWKALQKIPYGKTVSYSQIAKKVGSLKACRAVGAANGKNPLSVFVPCHRVIGASGALVGFGAGLEAKSFLLHLEGKRGAHLI